jgi:hypothetical protein
VSRFKAETENEKKKSGISLLLVAAWASFILALTTGTHLLYDYVYGFISTQQLLAGLRLKEVIIYISMGVAELLIHIYRKRISQSD